MVPLRPAPSVPLCAGCGAAAAVERDRCSACGTVVGAPLPVALLDDQARWARLECRFRCASCGVTSPLDQLETSGSVQCAHCGLTQSLDARVWGKVLGLAHDVVDLSGADPAVRESSDLQRDNPYRIVGYSISEWSWSEPSAVSGREPLELRASPGHPLCARCQTPYRSETTPAGLTLVCPGCGARETHAAAAALLYPGLVAAASVATRTDLPRASSTMGRDGVTHLSCPHCGAPLLANERSTAVACSHCHAPSLVSSKLWHRLGRGEPRPEPIWLLFSGRSARRQQLESRSANVDPFELELQARARAVLAAKGRPEPVAFQPSGVQIAAAPTPTSLVSIAIGLAALGALLLAAGALAAWLLL